MSAYRREILVAGVPVRCDSLIKSWAGWPGDVVETIRRWNRQGRLSFVYLRAMWGGYATGFEARTFKCSDCAGFFNPSGSTACRLDGALYCDDCIITRAASGGALTPQ